MRALNLIPAGRRQSQREARRVRTWVAIAPLFAAAVVGGTYAALPRRGGNELAVMEELDKLRKRAAELDQQLKTRGNDAHAARAALSAANAVGEQPDWSLLLAKLAEERGGEVVLESVELATVSMEKRAEAKLKPGSKAATRETMVVKLGGATRSPDEAYAFAKRLERTGLFASARVLETRPRDLLGEAVSGFRMECVLVGAPSGGRPAKATASAEEKR